LSGEGSSNCPSLGEETEALLGSLLVKKAKEGFFMPRSLPNGRVSGTSSFGLVVQSFLSGEEIKGVRPEWYCRRVSAFG